MCPPPLPLCRAQFWIQLIFGGAVQILHFFAVPETRSTVLLDREAKRRRKTGEDPTCYGPDELKAHRFDTKEVLAIMARPFVMFYSGAYQLLSSEERPSNRLSDPSRPQSPSSSACPSSPASCVVLCLSRTTSHLLTSSGTTEVRRAHLHHGAFPVLARRRSVSSR
jgi:hypothetical protein